MGHSVALKDNQASVLIIDQSRDNLEILETAVRRRSLKPLGTQVPSQGLEILRQQNPDLILLDSESISAQNSQICQQFEAESNTRRIPLIVLGKSRRCRHELPSGEQVATPYHYAPLMRKIEELLEMPPPANFGG